MASPIGYAALFVGFLLEGETALITGSYMVHGGFFSMKGVYFLAVATCLSTDWAFFFLARIQGVKFISNKPKLKSRLNRVTSWVEANPLLLLIFYRFIYGARIALLVTFGLSRYGIVRFLLFSLLSIFIWVTFYSLLGYYFGELIEKYFERAMEYQWQSIAFITILGVAIFLYIRKRNRRTE